METLTLELAGNPVEIKVRRNARARRIILRIARDGQSAVMTLPPGVPLAEGREMALRHTGWLKGRLGDHRPFVSFAPGQTIPFKGEDTLLVQGPLRPRKVRLEAGTLQVGGEEAFFARRLTDWLKDQAREDCQRIAFEKATLSGLKPGRIAVRDQRTRWGSCSSRSTLSFSWRLILAPPTVLEYVVAHEVAHLKHMNHGPLFWELVDELHDDVQRARKWLSKHGERLHRYGVPP